MLRQIFNGKIDPSEIGGICISGWSVMSFLVDNQFTIATCVTWKILTSWSKKDGDTCFERNGNYLSMYNGLAKLYWWKKHRPEILDRAKFLDFLVAVTCFSHASRSSLKGGENTWELPESAVLVLLLLLRNKVPCSATTPSRIREGAQIKRYSRARYIPFLHSQPWQSGCMRLRRKVVDLGHVLSTKSAKCRQSQRM